MVGIVIGTDDRDFLRCCLPHRIYILHRSERLAKCTLILEAAYGDVGQIIEGMPVGI